MQDAKRLRKEAIQQLNFIVSQESPLLYILWFRTPCSFIEQVETQGSGEGWEIDRKRG